MEWLWWAVLLFVVIGWPLLLVLLSIIRRRVLGGPRRGYAVREHARMQALRDARDVKSGPGWDRGRGHV